MLLLHRYVRSHMLWPRDPARLGLQRARAPAAGHAAGCRRIVSNADANPSPMYKLQRGSIGQRLSAAERSSAHVSSAKQSVGSRQVFAGICTSPPLLPRGSRAGSQRQFLASQRRASRRLRPRAPWRHQTGPSPASPPSPPSRRAPAGRLGEAQIPYTGAHTACAAQRCAAWQRHNLCKGGWRSWAQARQRCFVARGGCAPSASWQPLSSAASFERWEFALTAHAPCLPRPAPTISVDCGRLQRDAAQPTTSRATPSGKWRLHFERAFSGGGALCRNAFQIC